jgi:hypothetical protein
MITYVLMITFGIRSTNNGQKYMNVYTELHEKELFAVD